MAYKDEAEESLITEMFSITKKPSILDEGNRIKNLRAHKKSAWLHLLQAQNHKSERHCFEKNALGHCARETLTRK